MDVTKSMKYQPIPETRAINDKLLDKIMPSISLPNQADNLLQLNREETFRLVFYFYSMTGHPKKKLPDGWANIPGAEGCTLENCIFRDNYENLIELNALPIGISTQTVDEIKDMTDRLRIQHDVLSDSNLICVNQLTLPTFSIGDKKYIKRISIIVEKNIIRKVFYPIVSIHKHIHEVIKWLRKN